MFAKLELRKQVMRYLLIDQLLLHVLNRMKEIKWQNIKLLNDKIYGPSVGLYVSSITRFLGSDTNLFTFIYDKNKRNTNIEGNKLYGFYPPVSSGWFFNTTFQSFIFRSFKRSLVKSEKKNLIHYTSQQVKPFNTVNSTVTVHDLVPILFPEQTNRSIVRLTRRNLQFYRKLPIVSSVSEFTKRSMEDYGFDGKIHVIPNTVSQSFKPLGIPRTKLRKKLGLPENKILILSVSANYPRKNLNFVGEVVASLGSDYALVRVGPPVRNSITFLNVSETLLNEIYNACDVFFIPSKYEGFGLPLLEAMSSGIPVVASDIEIFHEVLGDASFLYPININDMKTAIKEAISDRENRVIQGIAKSKKYSFENFANKLKSFYEESFDLYGI